MADINIFPIAAFTDNYIWCLTNGREAVVVDPGQDHPVVDALNESNLKLTQILVTHHHPDHVGGIDRLTKAYPEAQVIGYEDAKYKGITKQLANHEEIVILGKRFQMIAVPGHTLDHVAFYCEELNALFPGDTLFSAGCGRLFEGSPSQMFDSLTTLSALPEHTKIFCAHEYTLANLDFALSLMPTNSALIEHAKHCQELRQYFKPTLPSTIEIEKQINPFLRQQDEELIENLHRLNYTNLEEPVSIFAATRAAKDNF